MASWLVTPTPREKKKKKRSKEHLYNKTCYKLWTGTEEMKSLLERAQEDLSLLATLERGQGWERTATTENSVFKLSTSLVGDRSINFTFPVWHLVRCARDLVSRCRPPCSPAVRASGGIVCPCTASGSDRGCRLAGLDREWSLISHNPWAVI